MAKKKIFVGAYQNLFDVALQEYGGVEGVFQLMADNGIAGVTDEIYPGQALVINKDVVVNKDILKEYTKREFKPAQGRIITEVAEEGYGFTIGFGEGFNS